MANIFQKIASYGVLGGAPGAYATNKNFRKGTNKFLFGEDPSLEKVDTMNPQQNELFGNFLNLLKQGGGLQNSLKLLQDYLNPESDVYKNFEAPYMREFNEKTIPGIAERFAGMGAQGGALSSSAFGQSLGAAGAGLQENLASMKSGIQMGALTDFLNQFHKGIGTETFAYNQKPGSEGQLGNIIAALMKGFSGGMG